MKINFKNGFSVECTGDASETKRSKRAEEQIAISEQIKYWQCNPDKYVEFITGVKLPWWRRLWMKLIYTMNNTHVSNSGGINE